MTPNIPSSFNKPYTSLYTNESNSSNYIPAMHQSNIDSYESKNKKTCRVLKTITSVFNSVLLTAGLCTAGFFGFKWLKSSNLSFMSNPLEQVRFSNDLIESSEIKGNEEQKNKLKNIIENCKKEKNKDGTPKGCGVLLQGPPRCGKTLSANVYAKESGLTTFSCKTSSIISTVKGQTEKNIDKMFEQLRNQVKKEGQPVILIMDEIDSFLMSRDNATNEERAMVNAFLRNCDNLEKQGIIILGSTNYGDKCDTAAIGSGRFNEKISFDLPKKEEIEEMLIGKKIEETTSDSYEQEIRDIAQFMFSNNMNWADAQNIKKECLSESDKGKIDTQKAFSYLINKCKGQSPIQISTLKADTAPGVNKVLGWDEIYGLDDVKEKFDGWFGKKTPAERESGFLLAGPGGCGKTTLPYALAQKQKTDVYTLRIGDKGVTVDNIKAIIDELKLEGLARQKEGKPPIILFIDEADAMIPNRKGVDLMANVSNSTERTTTLLHAMQNLSNYGICCIAATNNPENIDSAMKRGGRFNQIDIDMPDKDAVIKYIKAKFKDLSSNAKAIANKFMEGNKSKLSFANIDGVLKEWKQNVLKGKSNVKHDELSKLDKIIKQKKKQMDAKPLESGLTQIGKSLDEIKEAIQALKDEGTSKKLEELIGFINKNTEQNGEVVKNFNTALNELQAAMKHIANIAESNKDLGNKYLELTESVARALEEIKKPLDNLKSLPTTIQALTGAINSLTTKEEELKKLLETLKNDMPKGGSQNYENSIDAINKSILQIKDVLKTSIKEVYRKSLPDWFRDCTYSLSMPASVYKRDRKESQYSYLHYWLFAPQSSAVGGNSYSSNVTTIAKHILTKINPKQEHTFTYTSPLAGKSYEDFVGSNRFVSIIWNMLDTKPNFKKMQDLGLEKVVPAILREGYIEEKLTNESILEGWEIQQYKGNFHLTNENTDCYECSKETQLTVDKIEGFDKLDDNARKTKIEEIIKEGVKDLIDTVFDACWDGLLKGENIKI